MLWWSSKACRWLRGQSSVLGPGTLTRSASTPGWPSQGGIIYCARCIVPWSKLDNSKPLFVAKFKDWLWQKSTTLFSFLIKMKTKFLRKLKKILIPVNAHYQIYFLVRTTWPLLGQLQGVSSFLPLHNFRMCQNQENTSPELATPKNTRVLNLPPRKSGRVQNLTPLNTPKFWTLVILKVDSSGLYFWG